MICPVSVCSHAALWVYSAIVKIGSELMTLPRNKSTRWLSQLDGNLFTSHRKYLLLQDELHVCWNVLFVADAKVQTDDAHQCKWSAEKSVLCQLSGLRWNGTGVKFVFVVVIVDIIGNRPRKWRVWPRRSVKLTVTRHTADHQFRRVVWCLSLLKTVFILWSVQPCNARCLSL